MNYSGVVEEDIANGPGIRTSIFVSGCPHHCKGCFNEECWNYSYGEEYTDNIRDALIDKVGREYISGLSILGGEPLCESNVNRVTELAKMCKEKYPNKTIWCWTGYDYEEVRDLEIMNYIDVLIDGKFIESQKDVTLEWRGSSNQRIIELYKKR